MASGNPEAASDVTLFDVVLSPHRSLSPHGFRLLLFAFGTVSTLFSIPFYLLGAWPVIGFFGIDIALLYVCFRINYRAARLEEHIHLTPVRLDLSRTDRRGGRRDWSFNPLWVRLRREEHVEFGVLRLALEQRGREVEIAHFLGAAERTAFADAFAKALSLARAGPRFPQPS